MKEILFNETKYRNDLLLKSVEMYNDKLPYLDSDDPMIQHTASVMANVALLQIWWLTQGDLPAGNAF